MKSEYDLSSMRSRKNPYAAKLKKPVSMRLSEDVVTCFKSMANEAGVPYQSLINLYLRDCVMRHRKVKIAWPSVP
jgi:uncharacterized protein (DUF4415 family)